MSFNGFFKDLERLIEEVCCTTQGHMNLLECLLPSSFVVEGLKASMMFIHDRLLRIQHETIDGGHRCLSNRMIRQQSSRPCVYRTIIRMGG